MNKPGNIVSQPGFPKMDRQESIASAKNSEKEIVSEFVGGKVRVCFDNISKNLLGKVRICFHNISKNGENRENLMRH